LRIREEVQEVLRERHDKLIPRTNTMTVTQDDVLSLLNKYAEERTPVLAVFGTPSLSIARVMGTIRVSSVAGAPVLIVGEDESNSDQIKFRLSECVFEYGDFRDCQRTGGRGF
jgi:hypothetical protein